MPTSSPFPQPPYLYSHETTHPRRSTTTPSSSHLQASDALAASSMTDPDDRNDSDDGKSSDHDEPEDEGGSHSNEDDYWNFPRTRKAVQCVYECLGAPVLVYRDRDGHYSRFDEEGGPWSLPGWMVRPEPRLRDLRGAGGRPLPPVFKRRSGPVLGARAVIRRSRALLDENRRLRRSQARWYYPMDYHVLRPGMPDLDGKHIPAPVIRSSARPRASAASRVAEDEDDDDGGDNDDDVLDYPNIDWSYYKQRSLLIMEQSRANQLMAPLHERSGNDDEAEDRAMTEEEEVEEERLFSVLRAHQRYDRNWVLEEDYRSPAQRGLCRMYDEQRMDASDPSYMAPFPLDSLERSQLRCSKYGVDELFDWPLDDPNDPHEYGNTLLVLKCQCQHCGGSAVAASASRTNDSLTTSWFLLHPCGPLLDRVSLSCLQFPNDAALATNSDGSSAEALDVDDTVRQLVQCGTATFVARTRIHCIIFSVQFEGSSTGCGRRGTMKIQHKIDMRTLAKDDPYYVPVHVTCHPRYGNAFVDPMIAILLQNENEVLPYNNTIERINPGKLSVRRETHVIANLLEITDMDFSAHHPMVLWSAARPHDRPAVEPTRQGSWTPLGLGCSLYSIDLRTNEGTHQWSPSHEMYAAEGVHSISAVRTDWKTDHTLWVASASAKRTWEIDARMPVKTVSSWSTPHILDAGPELQAIPSMGIYGAGLIFTQPERDPATCYIDEGLLSSSASGRESSPRVVAQPKPYPTPVLAASTNPLAHGIHVYQRPTIYPLHEFQSVEACAAPELARQTHTCVAVSSVFPFCDTSDRTFTCGLASACMPVSKFLSREEVDKLGYRENDLRSVMCVFTMTNRGDLYSHNLLESHAEKARSVPHTDLPLGAAAVALPHEVANRRRSGSVIFRPGLLYVPLSNEYPVPSSALTASSIVDVQVTDLARVPERYSSRGPAVSDRTPAMTAPWTPTSQYVAQKVGSIDSPSVLTLPFASAALHDAIDEQLAKTMNRYDHQSDLARVVDRDEESYRSDVTTSFAALAAQAWPSLDDDDDDEE